MRYSPALAITLCLAAAGCNTPAAADTSPQMVIQVVRLQHTKSADLVATLRQFLEEDAAAPGSAPVKAVGDAATNSVAISGDAGKVQQALVLIARLDVAPGR